MYYTCIYAAADVGEGLRARQEAAAEESRQRAIRSTEEVVRREEAEKREKALREAAGRWDKERQQLFVEAHQSQLRAVAKHTGILEEKLRSEFAAKMTRKAAENKTQLEYTVEQTWMEAGTVQDRAVLQARAEERERARQEAERVRGIVAQEKVAERERALLEKDRALESQRVKMEKEKQRALEEKERELTVELQSQLTALRAECDQRYAELQEKYECQVSATELVQQELERETALRAEWEGRHERLRKEFADFIDKVPGFRAEFVLQ